MDDHSSREFHDVLNKIHCFKHEYTPQILLYGVTAFSHEVKFPSVADRQGGHVASEGRPAVRRADFQDRGVSARPRGRDGAATP